MVLLPSFITAIAVPSSLGFVKREYGVSFGYGGAIAAAGEIIIKFIVNEYCMYMLQIIKFICRGFSSSRINNSPRKLPCCSTYHLWLASILILTLQAKVYPEVP